MANFKLKIVFFFVKLFNLNGCTYMWFDRKLNKIKLYVGNQRSGVYYLPTEYGRSRKYAIFLADIGSLDKLNLKKSETIYVLEDTQTEEEFEKKSLNKKKTVPQNL